MPAADPRVTVVVATRDRRDGLLRTLDHLAALPERPPVVVVDNGSSDGTPAAVRAAHPGATVVEAGRNLGATARNAGVERASTPYVAFSDDDSWWAPGALATAADHLDAHPRLAVLAARMLVGDDERPDPVCAVLAASPLPPAPDLPGVPILGFVSCGAVVRRDAFLAVGGFDDLVFFLGEEELLAIDLERLGWGLAYVDDVVAHHHPTSAGKSGRGALQRRNSLLVAWMRRPLAVAAGRTVATAGAAVAGDRAAAGALAGLLPRLPAALRRRRPVDPVVERRMRLTEAGPAPDLAPGRAPAARR
ncbi:MAG TPA: glycosyltransferase [Acidimicrobiales bacterium]|jgi:GT2 family glycosyltransferase